jgi:hypothetical protein
MFHIMITCCDAFKAKYKQHIKVDGGAGAAQVLRPQLHRQIQDIESLGCPWPVHGCPPQWVSALRCVELKDVKSNELAVTRFVASL